jgi:serine/threonine-protein kinase
MSKKIDSAQFVAGVRRSGLVDADRLDDALSPWLGDAPQPLPDDPRELADALIAKKLLNDWQIDNLLKGKSKGFLLGKYKLLGHLGTGGMSHVYLAEHTVMERLVAIKVLPKTLLKKTSASYLDRFKREARAVAALDHPNIVRAYDIDQDDRTGTNYIVMEYVDGRDLQRMVNDDGVMDPVDAADFIGQAALGLQHAHQAGLIHRDVKPANCLVDKKRTLKLLDLGLAKFSTEDRPSISALHDDSVVGTADYLAPEQARNSQTVDGRADIYGLGCTLYFLLTGKPPFPDGTIAQRLLKHQSENPPSIYEKRPDAPPALVELCRRMMVKNPTQRIQSAREVAEECVRWLATRNRSLSAVYAEVGITNNISSPSSASDSRWTRPLGGGSGLLRSRPPAPPSHDTMSLRNDDTSRPGSSSSVNDDLTLAPLDEERTSGSSVTESGSSSSLIQSSKSRKPRPTANDSSSSGVLDHEVRSSRGASSPSDVTAAAEDHEDLIMTGGSLDRLMSDPEFTSNAQLPKTQLPTRSRRRRSTWTPILLTLGTMLGAALAVYAALQLL